MNYSNHPKLDRIVEQTVSKKYIKGAVFHITSTGQSIALSSASGNMAPDSLYYIASINKLFLSAITLRLCSNNQLNLSDKIAYYLPADIVHSLLVYKGKDFSGDITIAHLLSHTSGLPCYLTDRRNNQPKVMEELLQSKDQNWSAEQVIAQVKKMQPKFRPDQKGKAHYANTNFRLIGKILESVMQQPLSTLLTNLFNELKMQHTFVLLPGEERAYTPVYVKEQPVHIPHYLSSSGYDIISNAPDQMRFLKAFFSGCFYPKEKLPELEQWNNIFFPFKYGIGIQQFYTPRIFSPFQRIPAMTGHCGSTGTAAFYVPEKDLFITGAVNQVKTLQVFFQTMIKILNLF